MDPWVVVSERNSVPVVDSIDIDSEESKKLVSDTNPSSTIINPPPDLVPFSSAFLSNGDRVTEKPELFGLESESESEAKPNLNTHNLFEDHFVPEVAVEEGGRTGTAPAELDQDPGFKKLPDTHIYLASLGNFSVP